MANLIYSMTASDIIPANMAWDKSEYIGKDGLSTAANGKVEFVSANGVDAWHRLGQKCEGALTLDEALQYSYLDQWEVVKEKFYDVRGNETPYYGLYRNDTYFCLGVCKDRMVPRQPKDHFRFLDTLVQSEDAAKFDTAGALKGGKVLFCSINLGSFALFEKDRQDTYVAGLLSYDGSLAMQYFLTATRIVCRNTMKQALRNQGKAIKVRQTKHAEERLEAAQVFFKDALTDMETFKSTMERFSKYALSQDVYDALVAEMVPNDSTRSTNIRAMLEDGYQRDISTCKQWVGNDYSGTAYNLYNAATEYVDHYRGTKGEDKDTARATSALIGTGSDFKDHAFQTIHELVYA